MMEKFKDIFLFATKSKIKAGEGLDKGRFPFYTSSQVQNKWIDIEQHFDEALILGTGGSPSIHYESQPFSTSTDCFVTITKKKDVSTKYVYYYLSSNIHILERGFKGAGLKHLSKTYLEDIKIPLPALETQNKIVAILDKAKTILDKREETIKKYDELLRAVFLDMFGDPILNLSDWKTKPFDKVGKFVSGGTPDKSNMEFWTGNFPWVSPKDMKVSVIIDSQDHISETVFKRTNIKRLGPNHLLIVVRGMILAHSFPTAINSVTVAINQDMKAVMPDDDLSVIFLKGCLDAMKSHILSLVSTAGHGTKKFDSDAMGKLRIPIPPKDLQRVFELRVKHILEIITRSKEQKEMAVLLIRSLSQQVFSNRITIDVDAELEALINAIDVDQKDKENKIGTVKNDVTFIQRLIDRLDEQQFADKEQYDKARYMLFRLMKEEKDLVKQVFRNNKVQLTLQNETA